MNKLTLTLAGALVVSIAACSQKSEPQQAAAPQEAAPAAPAPAAQDNAMPQDLMAGAHPAGAPMQMNTAPQMGATPPGANSGEGKILQSMHASSYTYMQVDVGGKQIWIATNAMAVNTGDTVRWRDGAAMKNFTSTALHRTFDEILFVSYAEIAK